MIVDLAVVVPLVLGTDAGDAVEVLAAVTLDGERVHLAEEDAAGIHLVAAEFGHQAAAGRIVQPPVDELVEGIEAERGEIRLGECFLVFLRDSLLPAVGVGEAVVTVPLSANVLDVTQRAALHEAVGVVVQDAVMPLVTDGQQQVVVPGLADHGLAVRDGAGHQLFGQHVQAGVQAVQRDGSVRDERGGDDNRLDAQFVLRVEQLAVVVVDLDLRSLLGTELLDQSDAVFVSVTGERAVAVTRPQVRNGDDVHVLRWVLGDEDVSLVTGSDERDADRIALQLLVPEVGDAQPGGTAPRPRESRAGLTPTASEKFCLPICSCSGVSTMVTNSCGRVFESIGRPAEERGRGGWPVSFRPLFIFADPESN